MSRPICGSCGDLQGDDGCGCGEFGPPLRSLGCNGCEDLRGAVARLSVSLATERACGDRRTAELVRAEAEIERLRAEVVLAEVTQNAKILDAWREQRAEVERLRGLIREYVVSRRAIYNRSPKWSERFYAAEVKP